MKKNIIIFALPRTGTTAFITLIYNKYKKFKQHDIPFEYLNCLDSFIPHNWGWRSNDIDIYELMDHIFTSNTNGINQFYQDNQVPNFSFFHEYTLTNNIITKVSIPWHYRIFDANFYTNEVQKRIDFLQNNIRPYCFKYFPHNTNKDTWIDRDNTTIIALVRNNILEQVASEWRTRITNIFHIRLEETLPSFSQPLDQKRVNKNWLSKKIINYKEFCKRLQSMNPDVIISYETLCKYNLLSLSNLKKVNIEPIKNYYENFTEAKEMVKDIRPIKDKNIDELLETFA
jgi:hypothetical protein